MRYTRVYNAEDGTARFATIDVSLASAQFAPPAPPVDVSPPVPVGDFVFIQAPAGWTDPGHPAPGRQWMFVLFGRVEITAGGETRYWGPGDALFFEDTAPPGHGATMTQDTVIAMAAVERFGPLLRRG